MARYALLRNSGQTSGRCCSSVAQVRVCAFLKRLAPSCLSEEALGATGKEGEESAIPQKDSVCLASTARAGGCGRRRSGGCSAHRRRRRPTGRKRESWCRSCGWAPVRDRPRWRARTELEAPLSRSWRPRAVSDLQPLGGFGFASGGRGAHGRWRVRHDHSRDRSGPRRDGDPRRRGGDRPPSPPACKGARIRSQRLADVMSR